MIATTRYRFRDEVVSTQTRIGYDGAQYGIAGAGGYILFDEVGG